VIHYDYYADVPDDAVREFVQSSRLGRLVTVGSEFPHLGLYPFTHGDGFFELHLNRADEQIADLRERRSCLFELDEVLSTIPSSWVDANNASFATAYHRTIAFECVATLNDDPAALARQQGRLLARYQPGVPHNPLTADDPMYAGMLRALVAIRLDVKTTKIKFKLGQNRDFETRAKIVAHLRERGSELDRRSADALQWTIDQGWTTKGRTAAAAPR
jgi:predicted FMN-binding regulatory protein PaiB